MNMREMQVQRVTLISNDTFDAVVTRLDAQIGHPDIVAFRRRLSEARDETEIKEIVDPATQPNGIMEFARFILERSSERRMGQPLQESYAS